VGVYPGVTARHRPIAVAPAQACFATAVRRNAAILRRGGCGMSLDSFIGRHFQARKQHVGETESGEVLDP